MREKNDFAESSKILLNIKSEKNFVGL